MSTYPCQFFNKRFTSTLSWRPAFHAIIIAVASIFFCEKNTMLTAWPGNDNDALLDGGGGGNRKERVKNESLCPAYGMSSVMGERGEMEDAVAAVPSFCMGLHFFGVYDGHGGAQASAFCRERLHVLLAAELLRDCGERKWVKAMKDCFLKMDFELGGQCPTGKCCAEHGKGEICCQNVVAPVNVGSTAVVAVVSGSQIVVANCGDSRAVLSTGGKVLPLSLDHKPERVDETARIQVAGGRIIYWNGYRVSGLLSVSRSLGDRFMKQFVISEPEVTFAERRDEDEFLIMASDGLWDVVSNEIACQVVRKCLGGYEPPSRCLHATDATSPNVATYSSAATAAAAALLTKIAVARGSKDNISVLVIDLRNQRNRISHPLNILANL